MNLRETLIQIAYDFQLDAKQLIDYANEDMQTGYDNGQGGWPGGSIWGVEGQILYALIRLTAPQTALELGTFYGCSATHILSAIKHSNLKTEFYAVDNNEAGGGAGSKIPPALKSGMTFHDSDIYQWLDYNRQRFDFVFSDGRHESKYVQWVWEKRLTLVNPGGFLIEHDAAHRSHYDPNTAVGPQVMAGIQASGVDMSQVHVYLTEPSDCGLAIWRRPDEPGDAPLETRSYKDMMQEIEDRDLTDELDELSGGKRPKKDILIRVLEAAGKPETISDQLEKAQRDGINQARRVYRGDGV